MWFVPKTGLYSTTTIKAHHHCCVHTRRKDTPRDRDPPLDPRPFPCACKLAMPRGRSSTAGGVKVTPTELYRGVKDRSITQPRVLLVTLSPPPLSERRDLRGVGTLYNTAVRWPTRFVSHSILMYYCTYGTSNQEDNASNLVCMFSINRDRTRSSVSMMKGTFEKRDSNPCVLDDVK